MLKAVVSPGDKFGRWTVESASSDPLKADCVCACGTRKPVNINNMKRGLTVSCGCFRDEQTCKAKTTHGLTRTPEYIAWVGMIQRCTNENYPGHRDYGGRGITVDDSWFNFESFLGDIGLKPSKSHSMDRIDNDGNYCKSNCRWATKSEQCRNQRTTKWVMFRGAKMSLADAADKSGVSYRLLRTRMSRGWSFDRAISVPVRRP